MNTENRLTSLTKPAQCPKQLERYAGFSFLCLKNCSWIAGIIFTVMVAGMLSLSCNDDRITPPPDNKPKPGKRDYTWTVDTLEYPGSFQTLMSDMWASSAKDVYIVGHNDRGFGKMYHYDGTTWTPVKLLAVEGGGVPTAPIDLYSVHGFAPNDVWAVGKHIYQNPHPPPNFFDSSLVIHFDGALWKEITLPKRRLIYAIDGNSANNLTMVGNSSESIFHYKNRRWQLDSLPLRGTIVKEFGFKSIAVISESESYAIGSIRIDSIPQVTHYFLKYLNSSWILLDSSVDRFNQLHRWGYAKLWSSPWGKLYSVGEGVFVYNNATWQKLLETDRAMSGIYGSNENNIFVVGQFGRVYHWNGVDWLQLTAFPPTNVSLTTEWMYDVWTDDNEVFIIGQIQGRTTLILHGK